MNLDKILKWLKDLFLCINIIYAKYNSKPPRSDNQ